MIKEWVDLAAQGKWDVLESMQQCCTGRISEEALRGARKRYVTLVRAQARQLSAEELLELRQSTAGMALIEKNSATFWPLIYDYSLRDAACCAALVPPRLRAASARASSRPWGPRRQTHSSGARDSR